MLLSAAGPGPAQEPAPAGAPWDRPEARREARRALETTLELLRATERRDARGAADALRDPCWMLRLVALERLRVLGLDRETLAQLAPHAAPGGEVPAGEWPAWERARAFAQALPVAPPAAPVELSAGDALRALVSAALDRVERGPDDGPTKRRMAEGLLTLRALVPPGERAWLAEALGGLVEERALLGELGAPDLAAARGEDGAALLRWWTRNAPYLAWSARARRFVLDKEARSAGRPTEEHRQGQPWPPE